MKVVLDIDDSKVEFFMELMRNLDGVDILNEDSSIDEIQQIRNLFEAFNDIKLYENGQLQLTSARAFLDTPRTIIGYLR